MAFKLMNVIQALTGGKSTKAQKPDPERTPWTLEDFLPQRVPKDPPRRRGRRGASDVSRAERDAEKAAREMDRFFEDIGWTWRED